MARSASEPSLSPLPLRSGRVGPITGIRPVAANDKPRPAGFLETLYPAYPAIKASGNRRQAIVPPSLLPAPPYTHGLEASDVRTPPAFQPDRSRHHGGQGQRRDAVIHRHDGLTNDRQDHLARIRLAAIFHRFDDALGNSVSGPLL